MFNLAYPIEDKVTINGIEYKLDMSFDNVLRLFDLMDDENIHNEIKVNTGLLMLINDTLEYCEPQERATIFIELYKSLFSASENSQQTDLEGNPMPVMNEENKRVYDLVQDAEYIFASFYQDYGMDLIEWQGRLHWYKFKALLGGLRNDTKFKEVVEIRTMEVPKGKGTAKQAEQVRKLKRQYALKGDD